MHWMNYVPNGKRIGQLLELDVLNLAMLVLEKTTRRIELGWMDFQFPTNSYKQVKPKCGGGVRHISVDKSLQLNDVLIHARDTFFPFGISQRGCFQEFESELRDFQGLHLNLEKTVGRLYEESKLKILRVYLYTKRKVEKVR